MGTEPGRQDGAGTAERPLAGRVHALDGLRGLAALVVVLHHALLASAPNLASVYSVSPSASLGKVEWLLAYTPLHIVWAGQEFVVVFFVLSGFVLSLPAVRGKQQPASSYYPSRLLRLYIPVWGALAFAAVMHVAVNHRAVDGASFWLNTHSQALGLGGLTREATLVTGAVLAGASAAAVGDGAHPPPLFLDDRGAVRGGAAPPRLQRIPVRAAAFPAGDGDGLLAGAY